MSHASLSSAIAALLWSQPSIVYGGDEAVISSPQTPIFRDVTSGDAATDDSADVHARRLESERDLCSSIAAEDLISFETTTALSALLTCQWKRISPAEFRRGNSWIRFGEMAAASLKSACTAALGRSRGKDPGAKMSYFLSYGIDPACKVEAAPQSQAAIIVIKSDIGHVERMKVGGQWTSVKFNFTTIEGSSDVMHSPYNYLGAP